VSSFKSTSVVGSRLWRWEHCSRVCNLAVCTDRESKCCAKVLYNFLFVRMVSNHQLWQY